MRTDDSVRASARATAGAAPLARVRAREPAAAGACRAPVLACGAELKSTFCVARGAPRLGRRTTSATSATARRCAPSSEGIEHFERLFAVTPGGRRPRPAPRLPLDRVRARARGRAARRACSTTTPTSRPAWPSTASAGPAVGAIFDGTGLGHRRHGLGRRDPRRRPARLRARRAPVARAPARRRRRGARAVADGVRVAAGGRRRAAAGAAVARERWRAVERLARTRLRRARHDEHGPAVRRRRRALRAARARDLRGPGGDRARGRADPPSPAPTSCRSAPSVVLDARPAIRAVRSPTSRRGTPSPLVAARLHRAVARRDDRGLRAPPATAASTRVVLSGGVFQNRLLLERCAERSSRRRAARAGPRARPAERRRQSPTVRPPSPL